MSNEVKLEKIELDRLRYAVVHYLPSEFLQDFDVQVMGDWLGRTVAARFETELLAEHLVGDTYAYSFPRTPWQFWKERHAGSWWCRWFVRWRPVKMHDRTLHLDRYATYPQARVRFPKELGRPVLWERIEAPSGHAR